MGSADKGDDRTFKVNFSSDGAAKLKDKVNDKLKEFMGDYTDETLVEYVIVLLRNGRSKEEAKNELDVFLGDETHAFVSWLWDHLALNLNVYVQSQELTTGGMVNKSDSKDLGGKYDPYHMDSESERGKTYSDLRRSQHGAEWNGIRRGSDESLPFQSSDVENTHVNKVNKGRGGHKKSLSPHSSSHRKRIRHDEQQHTKADVSKATSNAPRRLLQFAVRDAVSTKEPVSKSTSEPSLKRLRSVVSTSTGETSTIHPQRTQSGRQMPNSLRSVVKAVAEAARDVAKIRSSGSVFDRLGRGTDATRAGDQLSDFRKSEETREEAGAAYSQWSNFDRDDIQDVVSMEDERELAYDHLSVEVYGNGLDTMGNRVSRETGTSGGSYSERRILFQHGVGRHANDSLQTNWTEDRYQSAATAGRTTNKFLKMPVRASTCKQQYIEAPNSMQVAHKKSVQESKAGSGDSGLHLLKGNGNSLMLGNAIAQQNADSKDEPPEAMPSMLGTGSHSGARPSEDADTRTIFVSNVHFAASKDDLSQHFNKNGDVLKVVILTDAATRQPKGAAYVEFMRKEAADDALSMNGTSFMSRILKVVKKSSAQQESGVMMSWPHTARASSFPVSRFRYPFPRSIPGTFRSRPPIKAGVRSFQWKRDAHVTPVEVGGLVSGNSIPAPGRSLTYIRTEAKPDGNPSAS